MWLLSGAFNLQVDNRYHSTLMATVTGNAPAISCVTGKRVYLFSSRPLLTSHCLILLWFAHNV